MPARIKENQDVFGLALKDYLNGKKDAVITVHSSLTEDDEVPVGYLFRDFAEMPAWEQKALHLSHGKVLDVGCCAGSHALYLQKKGLEVTGIDISGGAIEVAKSRGLQKAIEQNLLDHGNEKYDTILLLMNGSGIFENLAKAKTYLAHLKNLLSEKGQILLDASDIHYMYEEEDGSYWLDANHDYYGEVTYQLEYKEALSEPFEWLYLDFETLNILAQGTGFKAELILEGEHFEYLARLTK